jgi:NMD protein affecting ribosome stability and mRNA decay
MEGKEKNNKHDKYFEAVLQLRDFSEKQFNEIVDHIEQSDCGIMKYVEQKEGVDIYLTSQKFVQHLARWMNDKYNCIIKTSRKLHTRDTKANKDLYRVTVYAKFLGYKVGDIISYKGEKVKITSIGKKVSGKFLDSGKRIFIELDQIENS